MMHFSRIQEGAADQFAIKLLNRLEWSLEGFSHFMEKMVQTSGNSNYPMYLRTHPCSTDRLATIRDAERRYHSKAPRPTQFDVEFFKIKAKLIGCTVGHHIKSLKQLQNRLSTIPKSYHGFAQSIFLHRKGLTKKALDALTQFESLHQPDAFTWELRAQILFESGHNAQALQAIRTALRFRPKDINLKAYCAIMELDTAQASEWHKSVRTLEAAVFSTHQDLQLWYWLGIGLGKLNRVGEMHVAMAECALGKGNLDEAKKHTTFALKAFQKWDHRPIQNINLQKYILRARDLDHMFKQNRTHD
jgi:predicted Zn-dependent protease